MFHQKSDDTTPRTTGPRHGAGLGDFSLLAGSVVATAAFTASLLHALGQVVRPMMPW